MARAWSDSSSFIKQLFSSITLHGLPFTFQSSVLIIGLLFHILYIWSIFDIYFTSPLVHGMTPQRVVLPSPAKRLVLIVADGLRADKLYQYLSDENSTITTNNPDSGNPPFLKEIINEQGTWGVSHTRVPTESRPGHVALIAGFYEDVSAVTRGWKTNPVEFDSVFNQSQYTWSFGSPDILPMFAEGASDPDRVNTIMYSSDSENFAEDAADLDYWVFRHFRQLFANASSDPHLHQKLQGEQIIFFLHLLGLDTNGHAYGPHSEEYSHNIKVVDEGVREVVEFLENYYKHDGKTAYIFTSDHGMSNIGNHGDGHPDNTRTPLIAWGAGIKKPNKTHLGGYYDDVLATWNLTHLERNDASLIGINYPVNSVGELPLNYLDNTDQFKAQSLLVNAIEISEQYKVKNEFKKRTALWYKPFAPLSNSTHNPDTLITQIRNFIDKENYNEAEKLCLVLAELTLQGLRYLQTYDWLFLRSIVTIGYLGWIAYCLIFTIKEYALENTYQLSNNNSKYKENKMAKSPRTYYAYVFFPIAFWSEVLRRYHILSDYHWDRALDEHSWILVAGYTIGYILVLEVFVYSYFERKTLTACFIFTAFWPFVTSFQFRESNGPLLYSWFASCMISGTFLLLPVEKGESIILVITGGILIGVTGLIALWKSKHFIPEVDSFAQRVIWVQLGLIFSSTLLVYDTTNKLKSKAGLPLLNQILGWTILVISTSTPFIYGFRAKQHYFHRLINIVLAFAPLFVLLSISYEALFYFFFSITLLLWLFLEQKIYESESSPSSSYTHKSPNYTSKSSELVTTETRKLTLRDTRTALFFLFFIKVAFFGTGNVASLSSFYLSSVYRLTTVFNPFLMGALLLCKILIPFFIVSSVFTVVTKSVQLPAFSLFLLVLSTSDVMTLNFFYLVHDDGSWLEIGTTISHFCICSLFSLFMILQFWLSNLLVGDVYVPSLSSPDDVVLTTKRQRNTLEQEKIRIE
ncbi:9634_t:CDS:10 [Ambispora gerdemannii]|uniref:GPI ethanolamine phosphate transferase 1 n=1 Tax=Ambispora gerdemannii TaxID=144530 RepID=A0A9N8W1H8_9GLOM|nr:9634_t:CDS:10 [Ambispora gerdemannii]